MFHKQCHSYTFASVNSDLTTAINTYTDVILIKRDRFFQQSGGPVNILETKDGEVDFLVFRRMFVEFKI